MFTAFLNYVTSPDSDSASSVILNLNTELNYN